MARINPYVVIVVCLFAGGAPVRAQFWEKLSNPKFTVPIEHPPRIVLKGVTKIALRDLEGPCATELGDLITQVIFRSGRFEVIERSQVESVLREQNFQATSAVDPRSAARLGALLGRAALIVGRVGRCSVDLPDPTYPDFTTTRNGQRFVTRRYYRKAPSINSSLSKKTPSSSRTDTTTSELL